MALEALIFDVDGTLAETEETHRQALNATFADFGLPWNWDQPTYRRLLHVMGGKERLMHFIELDRPAEGSRGAGPARRDPRRQEPALRRVRRDGRVTLRPGVERLIAGGPRGGRPARDRDHHQPAERRDAADGDARAGRVLPVRGDRDRRRGRGQETGARHLPARARAAGARAVHGHRVRGHGLRPSRGDGAGLRSIVTPGFYSGDQKFSGAASVFDSLGDPAGRRGISRAQGPA